MNPLTNIKNLNKLNENEIKLGAVGSKKSWHNQYRDSAWCFFGGMPYELTEGDIICVFSQYGEVVNVNLIRDKKTGKSKGFGFICYENQMSTDLAVDNFNGTKILGRVIRVDHAGNYRPPKGHEDDSEITQFLREHGCVVDFQPSQSSEKPALEEKPVIKKEPAWDGDKHSRTGVEKQHSRPRRSRSRSRERERVREHRDRDRDRDRGHRDDHHRHRH